MSPDLKAFLIMVGASITITSLAWCGLVYGQEEDTKTVVAMRSLGVDSRAIKPLADAIDQATESKAGRALLISVAWHESRFDPDVVGCRKTGDGGKAVGAFQSWNLTCPVSVETQAKEALRHLKSARAFCKGKTFQDEMERAVSLYATGKTCMWSGAKARWVTLARVFPML